MMNILSPLQLKSVYLKRLVVSEESQAKPENDDVVQVKCGVGKSIKPELPISVEISVVRTGRKDIGYIQIALQAVFILPPGVPEELERSFHPLVTLANSIGFARNYMAQATAAFPEGSYWLPLINVNTIIGKMKEKEKKAAALNLPQAERDDTKAVKKRQTKRKSTDD